MSSNTFNKIKNYNLAIDGPTGSGKSSCGKAIANLFNLRFLETGEVYRLFAFFLEEKKINWDQLSQIVPKMLKEFNVEFYDSTFSLNGKIVKQKQLYTFDIEKKARLITIIPEVRKKITRICQKIIAPKNFLLVGRDTTSVIAPKAEIKIYLDASSSERAKRKEQIFRSQNPEVNWKKFIHQSNQIETHYPVSPLVRVVDALYFRNENITKEELVDKLVKLINEKLQLLPKVAIIGKTNAGKSTLFNALAQRKIVITSKLSHTTRDQFRTILNWEKYKFVLIDSGGVAVDKNALWQKEVNQRTQLLIQKADVVLWVVDAKKNIDRDEYQIKPWLKTAKKKTILVLNKIDSPEWKKRSIANWKQLGIPYINWVSALNKRGLRELKTTIANLLPKNLFNEEKSHLKAKKKTLLILGRTNSGKSSLFNLLIREQQSIVSEIDNTTTNIVLGNTLLKDDSVTLVDTAGIRKKRSKKNEIEIKGFTQSKKYLKRCDLALIIFDLNNGPTVQDKKIIALVQKAEKPFLVVGNKKDLFKGEFLPIKKSAEYFWSYLKTKKNIIYISIKNEQGISELIKTILKKLHNL